MAVPTLDAGESSGYSPGVTCWPPHSRVLTLAAVLVAPAFMPSAAAASDPTAFALELHRSLAKGRNVMSSAYSARQALGMAYIGAGGATRAEMAAVLRAGNGFEETERALRARLDAADGEATLKVANAAFLKKGYEFLPEWVRRVRASFGAATFVRDFGPAALAEINVWAAKATNGKIREILSELDDGDRFVLLNAVYFKGKWLHAFPKAKADGAKRGRARGGPLPETFHMGGGKSFATSLMSVHESFDYLENADLQAVRLPYKGGKLALIAVLPSERSTLAKFRAGLDAGSWRALRAGLSRRDGMVAMPKFKFENAMDLIPPLRALGMKLAFDSKRSDFSGLSRPKAKADELFISKVVQKTFVEVDEEGTEAAAVTAAVGAVRGSAGREDPSFRFVANRPFFFVIEELEQGSMLFVGEVHDPR